MLMFGNGQSKIAETFLWYTTLVATGVDVSSPTSGRGAAISAELCLIRNSGPARTSNAQTTSDHSIHGHPAGHMKFQSGEWGTVKPGLPRRARRPAGRRLDPRAAAGRGSREGHRHAPPPPPPHAKKTSLLDSLFVWLVADG